MRIGGGGSSSSEKEGPKEVQAVVKVLSEKFVPSGAIEQSLGWVWCPLKGIGCKDLGDNHFLVTFYQVSGKKRAMEDGPWMVGRDLKELVIVADFVASKTLEEIDFTSIPIWVRVFKLPLGMINQEAGKIIGDEIGKCMDVDLGDNVADAGCFLRVKVRLDISCPLRRGIMVFDEVNNIERWCPLRYEFLPEFCYVCGVIGHVDKVCEKRKEGDTNLQYDRSLRFIPERRKGSTEMGSSGSGGRRTPFWSFSGGGGRQHFSNNNRDRWDNRRSDAPSWKKQNLVNSSGGGKVASEEEETLKSLKKLASAVPVHVDETTKTKLMLNDIASVEGEVAEHGTDLQEKSTGDLPQQESSKESGDDKVGDDVMKEKGGKMGYFKRHPRSKESGGQQQSLATKEKKKKRGANDMDLDEEEDSKRVRKGEVVGEEVSDVLNAGLRGQSREQK